MTGGMRLSASAAAYGVAVSRGLAGHMGVCALQGVYWSGQWVVRCFVCLNCFRGCLTGLSGRSCAGNSNLCTVWCT